MNIHDHSLALALAWLEGIDNKVFLDEYNSIAQYTNVGPTIEDYLDYSPKLSYINMSSTHAGFFYGEILWGHNKYLLHVPSSYSRPIDTASNDEDYALAA